MIFLAPRRAWTSARLKGSHWPPGSSRQGWFVHLVSTANSPPGPTREWSTSPWPANPRPLTTRQPALFIRRDWRTSAVACSLRVPKRALCEPENRWISHTTATVAEPTNAPEQNPRHQDVVGTRERKRMYRAATLAITGKISQFRAAFSFQELMTSCRRRSAGRFRTICTSAVRPTNLRLRRRRRGHCPGTASGAQSRLRHETVYTYTAGPGRPVPPAGRRRPHRSAQTAPCPSAAPVMN